METNTGAVLTIVVSGLVGYSVKKLFCAAKLIRDVYDKVSE